MDDVYFINKSNGQVRELRFVFNTCMDSIYNLKKDFNNKNKKSENVIRLAQDYTKSISAENDIEPTNKLEALLSTADFNFQIPSEFLKK